MLWCFSFDEAVGIRDTVLSSSCDVAFGHALALALQFARLRITVPGRRRNFQTDRRSESLGRLYLRLRAIIAIAGTVSRRHC